MPRLNQIQYSFPLLSVHLVFIISIVSAAPDRLVPDSLGIVDKEPELVTFVQARYPVELSKQGVEGVVLLDILVNENGLVDSVAIVQGVAPRLDSAARDAAAQFVFKPAQVQNRPVAVIIRFHYPFSLKQILDSVKVFENLIGCVNEERTNKPLSGIALELCILDSVFETGLNVPRSAYMAKIGTFQGQHLERNLLMTTTDTLGRFSFKSLPSCRCRINIGGLEFKAINDNVVIQAGKVLKTKYWLTRSPRSQNEIVVYGHSTGNKVDLIKGEKEYGRTDDLNDMLTMKPGVASAPKAQSLLLVNGEGPYDNGFMLRGIPIFAPSHFAGVPYFDKSVFSLGAPLDIEFLTTGISGLYNGGSGSIVRIDPGILHDPIHVARPELLVNYGTLGADLTLSVPFRRGKDFYQVSYRPADKYALWFLNEYKVSGNNVPANFTSPSSYTDVQFLGSQRLRSMRVRQLVWLSEDTYVDSTFFLRYSDNFSRVTPQEEKTIPWGIFTLSLDSTQLSWLKSVNIGGALQHWFESKSGMAAYSKDVERKNVALSAEGPVFRLAWGDISTHLMTQYVPWSGRLMMPQRRIGAFTSQADSLIVSGYQADVEISQSFSGKGAHFFYGVNVSEGLFLPGPKGFVNPGLWIRFPFKRSSIYVSAGMITSQPDIRGMPSDSGAQKLVHSYNGSAKAFAYPLSWLNGSVEGFVKYKPYQPVYGPNPRLAVWDESGSTSLFSCGVNMEAEARLGPKINLRTVQSFSKSILSAPQYQEPYEWDIPWTNKTIISYSFIDTILTVFAIGNFYAGLPYHEVLYTNGELQWDETIRRNDPYTRIDCKLQFCQPVSNQRNLMQYDAYLLLSDLTRLYKDSEMRGLDSFNPLYHLHLGLRVRIRF
jgi:TonB family protein